MRIIKIIFISLMLSACGSIVNVDYDRNINFSSFKSYRVETKPVRATGDTRINSPFMQQRVVDELTASFANMGFENLNKKAELEVKYFLDIKQEVETQDSGVISIGFGSSSQYSAVGFGFNIPLGETSSIDLFVLTIDVLSTKTNELIWRGSLGYHLYEGATPESHSKMVKDLVTEILKNFPPK